MGAGLGFTILGYCDFTFLAASARLRCPFTSSGYRRKPPAASCFPSAWVGKTRPGPFWPASGSRPKRWSRPDSARPFAMTMKLLDTALAFAIDLAKGSLESLQATKQLMLAPYRDAVAQARRPGDRLAGESPGPARECGRPRRLPRHDDCRHEDATTRERPAMPRQLIAASEPTTSTPPDGRRSRSSTGGALSPDEGSDHLERRQTLLRGGRGWQPCLLGRGLRQGEPVRKTDIAPAITLCHDLRRVVDAWTRGGEAGGPHGGPQRGHRGVDPGAIYAICERFGYVVNTVAGQETEYIAPFGPGDGRIKMRSMFMDVSPEKTVRVGKGVFLTSITEYRTERADELIGRSRLVLLRYKPEEGV